MVKRIIIIGATSGIGYEVAKIYWKRGYQLGLAGRRVDRLEEFRKQDPEHIRIKQLDVTAEDAADRLDELIRDLGGMDIFLLSSGIGNQNKYLDTSIEQATIQTNVTGFTRMVLAAYRYFSSQGGGHISVISSIAGTKGLGVAPSYSATKRYFLSFSNVTTTLSVVNPLFFHESITILSSIYKRHPSSVAKARVYFPETDGTKSPLHRIDNGDSGRNGSGA